MRHSAECLTNEITQAIQRLLFPQTEICLKALSQMTAPRL